MREAAVWIQENTKLSDVTIVLGFLSGDRLVSCSTALNLLCRQLPSRQGHRRGNADLEVGICLAPTALSHAEPGAMPQELGVPDN
jgi:hypothetical protein